MIKLHVSACKKITDGNYGSRGGTVGLEIEVDSSLVGESAKLRDHIRKLFDLANASLTEELQANNEPASVEDSHYHRDGANPNGNGAGHAVTVTPVRFATEKQIICIQGLARKHGVPVPELLKQAGVRVFNDMSVRQASAMIESLEDGGVN